LYSITTHDLVSRSTLKHKLFNFAGASKEPNTMSKNVKNSWKINFKMGRQLVKSTHLFISCPHRG
jgi:hypothetical protein